MEFSKHLASQGTTQKLTTHDTPEYNGVSECLNRTLQERTHTLLHSSKLPKNLWGEVINHAVWLKNRMPTHALPKGKTPYEMLYGKKLDLNHLWEWGCKVWVHTLSGTKLDGRSKIGKWVGFDEPSNAHHIYWPEKCSITIEHSVKFDNGDMIIPPIPSALHIQGEKEPENQQRTPKPKLDSLTTITTIPKIEIETSQKSPEDPNSDTKTPEEAPQWLGTPFNCITDELSNAQSRQTRFPTQYIKDIQNGVGSADNQASRPDFPPGMQIPQDKVSQIEGEIENQIEYGMAAVISEAEAMDPQMLEEARCRPDWPKWEAAIEAELNALKKAGTWGTVERPRGQNIVQCKWVFRIKKDVAGRIERYKACLVAKGFTQVHGIDYYDTWAPVAKLASIHLLLAIAAQNGWPVDMFDFHSAFLNGELNSDEEVFMEQPHKYEEANRKKYVVRLFKSIYGLKQAG